MVEVGYFLTSEEQSATELVRFAQRAERAGFTFALISDHYHPWTDAQGQSPFVWSVIGAIAATTKRLRLGTGVTCPLIRIHPAIIAQAAATAAIMMPGRFFLGVGTGENLNEHITGRKWPRIAVRQEMLEEAVQVIRLLWEGGMKSHRGRYYRVENARVYTLPKEPPAIYVAAAGPQSAELAARIGDGLITVGAEEKTIKKFNSSGGRKKPKYAQVTVCWAKSEKEARRTALGVWPIAPLPWPLIVELAIPRYFEEAAELVTEQKLAEEVVCGPDPKKHLEAIQKCADAGADYVSVHQIGKDQEGFFRFYEREILPEFGIKSRRAA
ncbi:MAG: LLM class F420-dependent oxidoreductase [Acidobacteria bacterium 13_1_40CM_2_56_5]|nr:MAG: LLM class F420-dependent oxidoreductase [Acidobacteria bacterium 13_1_40CM_2_56_5]